jgi:glycosyltransferase involved in cell wall biosynthesis
LKITFLLTWAYGMGGLVRTTVNTANHFAELGHDVRIISFWRHRDEPFFAIRPDVEVQTLIDIREDAEPGGRLETWARGRPSLLMPADEPFAKKITLFGDYVLWRALHRLDADVLITTRPAYNLAAAMWAPKHTLTIGQDHLNYGEHQPGLRWHMKRWYPRLDAMVTLTEGDRKDYRRLLKGAPTTVCAIGNAVTRGPHPRTTQTEPVVVSAGRFTAQKRYDHLVRAFARVVETRPDWSLRLYGDGPGENGLRALIAKLGIGDNVSLMGRSHDTEADFAKASIMAMSSKVEGFPMVILEAFACGLPVVSYNCPRGPGEMITSWHDGVLAKNGSPGSLAYALLRLIDDPDLRRIMSANALTTAERNSIDKVGARWEELFAQLRAGRGQRPRRPYKAVAKRHLLRLKPKRRERVRWA